MLAATNQRLIAFYRNDGRDETFLTTVEEHTAWASNAIWPRSSSR